jgi:hypothetical protein
VVAPADLATTIQGCATALAGALADFSNEDFEVVEQAFPVSGTTFTVELSTKYRHAHCDVYVSSQKGTAYLNATALYSKVGAQEEQVSYGGSFNLSPTLGTTLVAQVGTGSSVVQRVASARSRACGNFRFRGQGVGTETFVTDTITITMIAWGKQAQDERNTKWIAGSNGTTNADVIFTTGFGTSAQASGRMRVASVLVWDARLATAGGTVGNIWWFAEDKATAPVNGDVCEPGMAFPLPGRPSFLTIQWAPSSRRFFKGFAWGLSTTDPTALVTLDTSSGAAASTSIEVE